MRLLISMRPPILPATAPPCPPPSPPDVPLRKRVNDDDDDDEHTWSILHTYTHDIHTHIGVQQRTVRVYVGASHAAAPQKCQYVGACTRTANELACILVCITADILEQVRRSCGIKSRDVTTCNSMRRARFPLVSRSPSPRILA